MPIYNESNVIVTVIEYTYVKGIARTSTAQAELDLVDSEMMKNFVWVVSMTLSKFLKEEIICN